MKEVMEKKTLMYLKKKLKSKKNESSQILRIAKHNTDSVLNLESTSLEWLARTGLVKYHFPPKSNPDTESDILSLGIITPQADAVVARIDSSSSNDYLELEIVGVGSPLVIELSSVLARLMGMWLWCITWDSRT